MKLACFVCGATGTTMRLYGQHALSMLPDDGIVYSERSVGARMDEGG